MKISFAHPDTGLSMTFHLGDDCIQLWDEKGNRIAVSSVVDGRGFEIWGEKPLAIRVDGRSNGIVLKNDE